MFPPVEGNLQWLRALTAGFLYTFVMDDVLFRSYNREQEEQPEDRVIFPSLEEPVYGPRRYPEGPATFTPGLGPTPPSRESLPPPEGALFTPMPTQEPQRRNPFQQFLDFIGITSADYGRVMRELGAQATSQFERSAEVGEQVGSSVMSRYFLGEFPESAEEATWDNFFMNQYMRYAPEGTTEEELQPYVDAAANRAALFQYEPLDLVLGDAADVARAAGPFLAFVPFNPSRFRELFSVGDVPPQAVTSARTSIRQNRGGAAAAPAVFTWLKNNQPLASGSINLDIGGGRFDDATDFVANEFNAQNLVYDPFNRTPGHNQSVINQIEQAGGANTVTVSNVLNVIPEEANRLRVIEQSLEALTPGGEAYFSVYPGNRSGQGAFTGADQYQANMPVQDYVPLIEQVYGVGNVERQGNIIIARRPADQPDLNQGIDIIPPAASRQEVPPTNLDRDLRGATTVEDVVDQYFNAAVEKQGPPTFDVGNAGMSQYENTIDDLQYQRNALVEYLRDNQQELYRNFPGEYELYQALKLIAPDLIWETEDALDIALGLERASLAAPTPREPVTLSEGLRLFDELFGDSNGN